MNSKRTLQFKAIFCGLLTLSFLYKLIFDKDEDPDFMIFMFIIFGLCSIWLFYESKKVNINEMPYMPALDATDAEKIQFYKRYMYLGIASFSLLFLMTAFDLYQIKNKEEEFFGLLMPVRFVFEKFGFAAALFFFPFTGLIIHYVYKRKINDIESRHHNPINDIKDFFIDGKYNWFNKANLIVLFFVTVFNIYLAILLNDFESGKLQNVKVWEPIALVYNKFGYWAAISVIPLFGIIVAYLASIEYKKRYIALKK